ncbi:MAG: CRISPR system precrRNA processing endoribonuclease RAMP protein Cas6 [Streptosporangiaceae bacterium]
MPTLIEMRLKATWTMRPNTRNLHGLACALFEEDSTEHLGQAKHFAVWPLRPASQDAAGEGPPVASSEWTWRAAWLPDDPPPARAVTADVLRVGHVSCTVTESTQRRVTRARLAAGPPMHAITVTFASPAYFSQNGTDVVLPDPRLIVGSWRRRWNSSLQGADSLAVDDQAWRDLHQAVRLAEFDLRTVCHDTGHGRDRAGFTGSATLRLDRNAAPSARAVFGTLARFAEYCGTGAQTTHGFGATAVSPACESGNG